MRQPQPSSHDVVIAGAGLVGLFLACELRAAQLSVLVGLAIPNSVRVLFRDSNQI
jgi:thioredoxin reductase